MKTVIHHAIQNPEISGEINRDDPGEPTIHLESGCNEFWLNQDEAIALRDYLNGVIPQLAGGDPL